MHKESIYQNDWYAGDYDEEKFGGSFGRFLEMREVELFLSLLESPTARILDMGTGTGKLSIPLLESGHEVVAGDASAEMLLQAVQKAQARGLNLRAEVCDATKLSFGDREFDYVLSSRMLMHLSDWRKGIAEMCRVSRSGVVLDFPPTLSSSGFGSLIRKVINPFLSERSHRNQKYISFGIGEVAREFEKNGYKVVRTHRQYFLPVGVHRIINQPGLSLGIERLFKALGLVAVFGAPVTMKAVRNGNG